MPAGAIEATTDIAEIKRYVLSMPAGAIEATGTRDAS